jgi:hypothetical protein
MSKRRVVGLAVAALPTAVLVVSMAAKLGPWSGSIDASSPTDAEEPSATNKALAPAANLRIRVQESKTDADSLLEAAAPDWNQAPPTAIIVNRTPRIYQTEPAQDHPPPPCEVRALRAGGKLILRLVWKDKTKNAPLAPPAKHGEAGKPDPIYKRPTGETSAFADAAAVMIPDDWTGPCFPSLLMGDKNTPARLYYWNASRGAAELTASGRATPQPNGRTFPFRARYAKDEWILTMEVPDQREGYPIAFAIWDGQSGDRDGLKFFSIWYVLTRN